MIELTIIIPHYNSVKLLKKLLSTIPRLDSIQIIVVDDNSDKDINEYNKMKKDAHYNHILFTENNTNKRSAGACRNIGIKLALGNWILFADADDFFIDGFYEKLKIYFNTNNDIVYFTPTSIELDTGEISNRHKGYEQSILRYKETRDLKSEMELKYIFIVPWSKLIRKQFIINNNISFDEVIAANDVMFSTKVGYYLNKFDVSTDIIYCVTKSRGTLTGNINKDVFESRIDVLIDQYNFLRKKLTIEEFKLINLNPRIYIINAIKFKLGFRFVISTYIKFYKNNINIFEMRLLNPFIIISRIRLHYKENKKNKKYLVK